VLRTNSYNKMLCTVWKEIMNLNQVTLPVTDMKLAADFYRKLGFLQIVDTEHYSRFECPEGGSSFSLSLENIEFSNGSVIYFEHENLDEWVRKLKSEGVHFDELPSDRSYLWREAVLHDPSGNKIKLYWAGKNRLNPPWRVEISA
jgi:catechol 2,3-dioxygenase-like lactoylglutathione lyase family enzyme